MAQFAVISSSQLFDPSLNPSQRMDATYGIWLARVMSCKDASELVTDMQQWFSTRESFLSWKSLVRKAETFEEVKKLIVKALFRSRYASGDPDVMHHLSARLRPTINMMARQICRQQAAELEAQITDQVSQIDRLKKMADTVQ